MNKEVTFTTAKVFKIEMNEQGLPETVVLEPQVLLGDYNKEQAQRKVEGDVQVFDVETESKVYEMEVEEFIKVAKVKED